MAPLSLLNPSLPTTYLSKKLPSVHKRKHSALPFPISCRGSNNSTPGESHRLLHSIDRRAILLGIGGLYGTSAGMARSDPIEAPILFDCVPSDVQISGAALNCCPPVRQCPIIDFVPPPRPHRLRVRPAAHLVDAAYVAKYEKAVALMKSLPPDDPRSFLQQANAHCAYLEGAYDQVGFPDLKIQIYDSWLFFPWHRFYVYFHERILAKLIGDETFALPYWNYDSPRGMTVPSMYTNPFSPLYDPVRDPKHRPHALVNLDYPNEDEGVMDKERVERNLWLMYRQMVTNAKTPEMFFGCAYRAGDPPGPGAGSIELKPNNTVHLWTGDPAQRGRADMGAYYSSSRDPIFFAHHCNVDRLWCLWKELDSRNKDIRDRDWLNTSFHFYDENAQLVKVKVKDCLNTADLGYTYQEVDLPWLDCSPEWRGALTTLDIPTSQPTFPLTLDSPVSMVVKRPIASRSQNGKAAKMEVLVVDGINLDRRKCVTFDVYVDVSYQLRGSGPKDCEKVGSFVNVPHGSHMRGSALGLAKTKLRLGLTDVLDTKRTQGLETVIVTLVPRVGCGEVTVASIGIEFSS